MLYAKDYRARAWTAKRGKWGTLALTYLVYAVFAGICGAMSRIYIGEIIWFLVLGAFTLGLTIQSLKIIRNDKPKVDDIFTGFKSFGNALLAHLIVTVFTVLWTLLLIVPGIIKSYSYSMTYYVMSDEPEMSANDTRKKSMQLMQGNKWRLFCLDFSFIGWYLLCILTLGILTLWIAPYHKAARAAFYQSLLPNTECNAPDSSANPSAEQPHAQSDDPYTSPYSEPDPFDNGTRL